MKLLSPFAFVSIILFTALDCSAVTSFDWAIGFGGATYDTTSGITTDPWGDVISVGGFSGTVNLNGSSATSSGDRDIFICKKNPLNGAPIWSRYFGGSGADCANSVYTDGGGNILVAGYFSGTVNFDGYVLTSIGYYDAFIIRLNSSGICTFAVSFGSVTGHDVINSIQVDQATNDLIVGGYYAGTTNFGSGLIANAGGEDAFVARYTYSGQLLWVKTWGSSGLDMCMSLDIDLSGNIALCGWFSLTVNMNPSGSFPQSSGGGYDPFAVRLDGNGNFLGYWRASGTSLETANCIRFDTNGNMFITGAYGNNNGNGNINFSFGSYNSNYYDGYVVKIYPTYPLMQEEWVNTFGSNRSDGGYGLELDANNDVYVVGYITGSATFPPFGSITPFGNADALVAKYTNSSYGTLANCIWAGCMGGEYYDQANNIAIDALGSMYVNGTYNLDPLATHNSGTICLDPTRICPANGYVSNYGNNDVFVVGLGHVMSACNFILSVTSTPSSCSPGNDGTATVNVSPGPNSAYSFFWSSQNLSNAIPTATATGLTPGDYHVIVTDASGCTQGASVTVSGGPSNLSNSNITSTGATFSWTGVPGATSYNVQYRPVGTTSWTTVNTVSTSINIPGLNSSTNYEWQVQAICGGSGGAFIPGQGFTTLSSSSCGNPTNLISGNINTTGATLNWSTVSGATGYIVQFRPIGSTVWTTVSTSITAYGIGGLMSCTTYEWQIQAICPSSSSSYVAGPNFTTLSTSACGSPSNLSVSSITTSGATLTWTAVSGAVSYHILYRPVGSASWTTTVISSTSCTLSGLNASTTYEWQVQAYCSCGPGSLVAGANFTTLSISCGDPSNLSVSNLTTSGATISWNSVSGAVSYNVLYRPIGSTSWTIISTTSTSYILSGLSACTNYQWQVQTVCTGSSSSYVTGPTFTTSSTSCGNATNLVVSNITSSGATVSWTGVSGAVSYNVLYRPFGSGSWTNFNTGSLTYTISGLSSFTTYEWRIQAVCLCSSSAYAVGANFTTLVISCGNPTNLFVSNTTTSSASATWTAVSGASSYNIQYRPVGSTTWASQTTTNLNYTISGLSPCTGYEWQVQANCPGVSGSYVTGPTFTTSSTSCGNPFNLSASNVTVSGATLSWSAVSGALRYNVLYRTLGSAIWIADSTTATTYTFSGLNASTTYEWRIQAVCICGTGSAISGPAFTTLPYSCGDASNLSVSNLTTSGVRLSWTAVPGAVSYNIQYRPVGSANWSTYPTNSSPSSLSGLSACTSYEWQVQAVCSNASGAYITGPNFTTLATTSCGNPTNLSVTSVTTYSAMVSWTAVSGALNYNVQYRPAGSSVWTTVSPASTPYTISGLNTSVTYEWQVQAVCACGAGSYVSGSDFTTASVSCGDVSSLSFSNVTATGSTVRWTGVSGAMYYHIQYRASGSASWTTTDTSSTSLPLTGLTNCTSYEWRVQSVCSNATGTYVTGPAFTTSIALPTANLSTPQCILTSSPAYQYQWLFNGNPIPNATGQSYQPMVNGFYQVQSTNSSGCTAVSAFVLVTCAVGIDELDPLLMNITPYPNPANDRLLMDLPAHTELSIDLFTMDGRWVMTLFNGRTENTGQTIQRNIQDLPAGLYTVYLRSAEGMAAKRVAVMH